MQKKKKKKKKKTKKFDSSQKRERERGIKNNTHYDCVSLTPKDGQNESIDHTPRVDAVVFCRSVFPVGVFPDRDDVIERAKRGI